MSISREKWSRTTIFGLLGMVQLLWHLSIPVAYGESADCSLVSSAADIASEIRGLRVKSKIPCRVQNREEVERYLREAITKKNPAIKLQNEERVLKLLGLLPLDFDYAGGLIKLYTEQLGGYYDPEKNYYAMAAWMPAMLQLPIAVHELTHALQDQHYDLQKLLDEKRDQSDVIMARLALVEGDATAVMLDHSKALAGQPSVAKDKDVSGFMVQSLLGSMLSPGVQSAPKALQAMMLFPYVSGLHFVHTQLRQGGYRAVDQVYRNPPSSTEEILHPEKYRKQDYLLLDPLPPSARSVGDNTNPKPTHIDRMGEFAISTLLGTYLDPDLASKAAAGWGGDIVALYDSSVAPLGTLTMISSWDTAKDAQEFFDALKRSYEKRFGVTASVPGDTATFAAPEVGGVKIVLTSPQVKLVVGGPR